MCWMVTAATTSAMSMGSNKGMSVKTHNAKTYVDMWYGDPFIPKKYGADARWSDIDCVYRGNIYDDTGRIIGDYQSPDSTWIQNKFLIEWMG